MTDVDPTINDFCAQCEDSDTSGIPAIKPPCTHESCSVVPLGLDKTGGRLGFIVRLRGSATEFIKRLKPGCDEEEDCGVLRCFVDPDGIPQGLDVDLFNDPATLEGIDCTDADGNSLYSNALRRIRNEDGSCSLGVLPFPVQDITCVEADGCDGLYPEGNEGDVFEGCGPSLCHTITNSSCYPLIVVPKLTIEGAEVTGPVTIEVQSNVNGDFQEKIGITSGTGITCDETSSAGTGETTAWGGETTQAGGGSTSTAGTDSHQHNVEAHTHDIPDHTHDGPSHSHTVDCQLTGRGAYTGTTEFLPVEVAPGDNFTYCVDASIRYDADVTEPGTLNYGKMRLCLDQRSKVTADTISQLEGTTT